MTAPPTQHGMTLIECMIALTLGMLVILACTGLLLAARNTYLTIDDNARITDTGAFALAAIGAAIRQAGYADRAGDAPPPDPPGKVLYGWDDAALSGNSLDGRTSSVNGSDVLFTRFMATSATGAADDNMLNCAGHASKSAIPPISADAVYNWSILYIARNGEASREPELFCKYRTGKNEFSTTAIARGVESMQLLYGVDLNDDGLPDTFLNASAVDALDGGRQTPPGHWAKVVAVRIALAVRGDQNLPAPGQTTVLDLFGPAYSALHATDDPGVRLDTDRLKKTERNRARRIFRSTVMLRNRNGGQ